MAKAGKPIVKVTALNALVGSQVRRLGFMAGRISVPDDFDRMAARRLRHSSAVARETSARYPFSHYSPSHLKFSQAGVGAIDRCLHSSTMNVYGDV
jgi:hypothetical protein